MTQADLDNHANQLNPNSEAYQDMLDNRSNQLNPNNEAYWSSRGLDYQNPDLEDDDFLSFFYCGDYEKRMF